MAFPQPWAWYRGDDLTGYGEGDLVPAWPDKAGGLGTTNAYSEWEAGAYTSDVFAGHPGIGDPDDNGPYYHIENISKSFPNGLTFGLVIDGPGDIAISMRTVPFHAQDEGVLYSSIIAFNDGEWECYIRSTDTWDNHYTRWSDSVGEGLPLWSTHSLLIMSWTSNSMSVWRDKQLAVNLSDISTAINRTFDEFIFWGYQRRNTEPKFADILVWDRVLTEQERCCVNEYAYERYGTDTHCPECVPQQLFAFGKPAGSKYLRLLQWEDNSFGRTRAMFTPQVAGPVLPQPWFWLRGDDLVGYSEGDVVDWWPSKADGGGKMPGAEGREWNSELSSFVGGHYTSNAVGGHPGITSGDVSRVRMRAYHDEGATSHLSPGITVFTVGDVGNLLPGATGHASYIAVFADYPLDIELGEDMAWAWMPGAYVEQNPGSFSGSHSFIASRHRHDGFLRMWVNNTLIGEDSFSDRDYQFWQLDITTQYDSTATVAECLVWDRVLDEAERGQVWTYAQQRYGL